MSDFDGYCWTRSNYYFTERGTSSFEELVRFDVDKIFKVKLQHFKVSTSNFTSEFLKMFLLWESTQCRLNSSSSSPWKKFFTFTLSTRHQYSAKIFLSSHHSYLVLRVMDIAKKFLELHLHLLENEVKMNKQKIIN